MPLAGRSDTGGNPAAHRELSLLQDERLGDFTFPITAWPPSFTCTCPTLTNCEPPFRTRRKASTWVA